MKNNYQAITILKSIAVAMLFGALADNPYGYYQILRLVMSGMAGYLTYLAYENKQSSWVWIFGVIAVLFNPIAPIYLDRGTWAVIDVITAVILFISIVKDIIKKRENLR